GDGSRGEIRSQDVNEYIRAAIGAEFTSKHFRTWGATVAAALELSALDLPPTRREQAMALNQVMDKVARRLRNTRAICRRCYVHPVVVEAYEDGRLAPELRALRRRLPRPLKGLAEDESLVLRWLERN